MAHQATRVLAVLELLQTHGQMSGSELAQRLEVDGRTLRRYIAVLEELGIPITTERGRHGGYSLVAGFKIPPMMFTDDEALALSVGLLAARGLGLAETAPAVESVQAKLERVMPAKLKRRLRALDDTVTLDLSQPVAASGAALKVLTEAAQTRKQVRMRYRSAQRDETERDFDPYGLAYRGGRWYAVGMCHLRRGLRSFRLDRMTDLRLLETSFTPPPDFDALGHLTLSLATLPRAFAVEVVLDTDLESAQRAFFPSLGVLEQVAEGVLMRSQVDDLNWFARELARLSFAFEVRRPAALREALKAHAERLVRHSQAGTPSIDTHQT